MVDSFDAAREFVFGYLDELRHNSVFCRFVYHYFFRHAFSIQVARHVADSQRRLIEYLASVLWQPPFAFGATQRDVPLILLPGYATSRNLPMK